MKNRLIPASARGISVAGLALAMALGSAPSAAVAADAPPAAPAPSAGSVSLTSVTTAGPPGALAVASGTTIASSASFGSPQYPSARYSMLGNKAAWLAVGGSLSGFRAGTDLPVNYKLFEKARATAGIKEAEWSRSLVIYTTNKTLPRPINVGVFIEGTVRAANFWKATFPSVDPKRLTLKKTRTRVSTEIYQWTYYLDGRPTVLTSYRVKSALMIGECTNPTSNSASWPAVKACSLKLAKAQAQKAGTLVANAPLQASMPSVPGSLSVDLSQCAELPCVFSYQMQSWRTWSILPKPSGMPFTMSVTSGGLVKFTFTSIPPSASRTYGLSVGTKYSYSNPIALPLNVTNQTVTGSNTVYDSGLVSPTCQDRIDNPVGQRIWCGTTLTVSSFGTGSYPQIEAYPQSNPGNAALTGKGYTTVNAAAGQITFWPVSDNVADVIIYRLRDSQGALSGWRFIIVVVPDNPFH